MVGQGEATEWRRERRWMRKHLRVDVCNGLVEPDSPIV